MDLTGVVADVYMCEWDKVLLSLMREEDIESMLYKRYKDDVDMISDVEAQVGSENLTSKQVMQQVKVLAESIDDNLKVTTDAQKTMQITKSPS